MHADTAAVYAVADAAVSGVPDIAVLDAVDHHDLRIDLRRGAAFGDAINVVTIVPAELAAAQRDYPIVLRRDPFGKDARGEGHEPGSGPAHPVQMVALLGLDRDENLFLEGAPDDMRWLDRHIPLVLQRGPFLIGRSDRDLAGDAVSPPRVHIDLGHPAIGADGGEPVFLPQGGHSPYLDHIIRVLGLIDEAPTATAAMIDAFIAADLIEPLTLQIALDETICYDVPDCYGISATRLAGLDAAALSRLNAAGVLGAAFMIAASLGNVAALIERKNRKRFARPATVCA